MSDSSNNSASSDNKAANPPAANPAKPQTPVQVTKPRPAVGTPINPPQPKPVDPFKVDFDAMVAKTLANSPSPLTKSTIDFMEGYVVDMAPGNNKYTYVAGADYQKRFFKVIRAVIDKSPPNEFRKNWIILLSYFMAYRQGALGERYVNRWSESWQRGDVDLKAYQRIVNLMLLSRDPKDRATVTKQASMVGTTEVGFSEAGRTNLNAFYQV